MEHLLKIKNAADASYDQKGYSTKIGVEKRTTLLLLIIVKMKGIAIMTTMATSSIKILKMKSLI
jgi:hypothetical protein